LRPFFSHHAMPTNAPIQLDSHALQSLLARAAEARQHAYAPYSGFTVGAALLTAGGQVVTGCNVENASYGLANCAERTAIFTAVAQGEQRFRAIAIVGLRDEEPCMPCGACRQVMFEFGPDMLVVTSGAGGEPRVLAMRDLLPHAFDPSTLPGGPR
jgi:cytidine deaminase